MRTTTIEETTNTFKELYDSNVEFLPGMSDRVFQTGEHVSMKTIERAHIEQVVASTSTLREAARVLDIDYVTLYRKRKCWGDHTPDGHGSKVVIAVADEAAPTTAPHMSWHVQPPEGVPLEIHNWGFWLTLRIGLRLLEPKSNKAALWVKYEALEIVESLPTWVAEPIQGERRNGYSVGWLAVQAAVPMLTHFTGWNVYIDDGMTAPFEMRADGRTIKGTFE